MGPSSLRSKRCVFAGSPEPQHLPLSGQSGFCSAIDWCPVFRDGLTRTGVSRYAVFRFFFGAPPASFSSISGISSLSRYSCCSASDPVAPAMADLTTFFLNCTGLSRPGTLNGCSRSCTCGLQSPPPYLQSRLRRPEIESPSGLAGSRFSGTGRRPIAGSCTCVDADGL